MAAFIGRHDEYPSLALVLLLSCVESHALALVGVAILAALYVYTLSEVTCSYCRQEYN